MCRLCIDDGKNRFYALLNDTLAAKDFERRLPLKMKLEESKGRYEGSLARGIYDPLEQKEKQYDGNLLLEQGKLQILCSKENLPEGEMGIVIGRLEKESFNQLKSLGRKTSVVLSVVKENEEKKTNENL